MSRICAEKSKPRTAYTRQCKSRLSKSAADLYLENLQTKDLKMKQF